MATIAGKPTVHINATLTLDEGEIRALAALLDFNVDDVFMRLSNGISPALIRDHGESLKRFFTTTKTEANRVVAVADRMYAAARTPE